MELGHSNNPSESMEIFAFLPSGKLNGPDDFKFFHISPLNALNLALILGAKLDGHRGTWSGRIFGEILKSLIINIGFES